MPSHLVRAKRDTDWYFGVARLGTCMRASFHMSHMLTRPPPSAPSSFEAQSKSEATFPQI